MYVHVWILLIIKVPYTCCNCIQAYTIFTFIQKKCVQYRIIMSTHTRHEPITFHIIRTGPVTMETNPTELQKENFKYNLYL